jgi:predicted nucleic acid-binding protein
LGKDQDNDTHNDGAVLDTRPLINFVGHRRVDILLNTFGSPLLVTAAVISEVEGFLRSLQASLEKVPRRSQNPTDVQLALALQDADALFLDRTLQRIELYGDARARAISMESSSWGLHSGEADTLAAAVARRIPALVDDRAAHVYALEQGIVTFGTLDVLIRAHGLDVLSSADAETFLEAAREQYYWTYAPVESFEYYLQTPADIW